MLDRKIARDASSGWYVAGDDSANRDMSTFANPNAIADRNVRPQIGVISYFHSSRNLSTRGDADALPDMAVMCQMHLAIEFCFVANLSKAAKSRPHHSAFGLDVYMTPNTHTSCLGKNSIGCIRGIHFEPITPDDSTSADGRTLVNNSSRKQYRTRMHNTVIADHHIVFRNDRRWMHPSRC